MRWCVRSLRVHTLRKHAYTVKRGKSCIGVSECRSIGGKALTRGHGDAGDFFNVIPDSTPRRDEPESREKALTSFDKLRTGRGPQLASHSLWRRLEENLNLGGKARFL